MGRHTVTPFMRWGGLFSSMMLLLLVGPPWVDVEAPGTRRTDAFLLNGNGWRRR